MSNLFKGVPKVVNGDTVVGFVNSNTVKQQGYQDTPSMASWYEDDAEKNHLGLVETFSAMTDVRLPIYRDFFKNKSIMNVNGMNGKFTYDLPVVKRSGCYTAKDLSNQEYAGNDSTTFEIAFDRPFVAGDVLTYDAQYGEQVIVSEDHVVRQEADYWVHTVKLVSTEAEAWFPADKLAKGIQYFKIGHSLGEFSEQFSNFDAGSTVGSITCEFTLGNHRGVETFYTMYADKKSFSGAAMHSQRYWKELQAEAGRYQGVDGKPLDMYFVGKAGAMGANGKPTVKEGSMRIGATLEFLVVAELMKLEAHQLLFQKPAVINDINGMKRLNEGAWHSIRRGRIIKYSREGGITRNHIQQAAAYVFRSRRDLQPHERRLKFKCGQMAWYNMTTLFKEEFIAQISEIGLLLGTDRVLPKSPVGGKSLTSLTLEPIMVTQVTLPEIGIVTVEHDPSLDYMPMTERNSAGMFGQGYPHTSYSMVIWDAADDEYSNALTNLPTGAKLIEGGNKNANMYLVKPEGDSMWWGYQQGRYSPSNAKEIASSMKKQAREFWAHSVSASWVRDISRYIIIELAQ